MGKDSGSSWPGSGDSKKDRAALAKLRETGGTAYTPEQIEQRKRWKREAAQRKAQAERQRMASEVIVKNRDGDILRVEPALSSKELLELTRDQRSIPPDLRTRVMKRDLGTCRYCYRPDGPMELDHVRPWSKGGSTSLENLVVACRPCNQKKADQEWKPRPIPRIKPVR
jgi:hypothetical protein